MKINRIVKGLLALFVATGFTFTSCAPEADGGLSEHSEKNLSLTGRVYQDRGVDKDGNYFYTEYLHTERTDSTTTPNQIFFSTTGTTFVTSNYGRGQIKNGHLNITIREPNTFDLGTSWLTNTATELTTGSGPLVGYIVTVDNQWDATNANVAPRYVVLSLTSNINSISGGTINTANAPLRRLNRSGSRSDWTEEEVIYIFVDKPTTIRATSSGVQNLAPSGVTYTSTYTRPTVVTLGLKVGWNAIYTKYTYKFTAGSNTDNYRLEQTHEIKVDSPALKWVR